MKRVTLDECVPHIAAANPEPTVLQKRFVECWQCTDGWLVTEVLSDELFIWCYAGRYFVPLLRKLAGIALDNGIAEIGWFTRHCAPLRVLRYVRGFVEFDGTGESRFRLKCEDICRALPLTLPELPRFARSRDTMLTSGNDSPAASPR